MRPNRPVLLSIFLLPVFIPPCGPTSEQELRLGVTADRTTSMKRRSSISRKRCGFCLSVQQRTASISNSPRSPGVAAVCQLYAGWPENGLFPEIFREPVVAQFDQREGSSDGGALLLKAAYRHYGLVEELSACLRDQRQAGKVDHTLQELVAQRVFSIACGYPDANDSERLGGDPIHKLLVDRDPIEGHDLASQPTRSRGQVVP